MEKNIRLPLLAGNFFLLVVMISLWIAFAPLQIGGKVSYVIVNGISMEPNYHTGDLILVRQADLYEIGDVVAYHDPEMRANIIHRIIAIDSDNYTIQGDNNSWIDGHRPTKREILGKLWIYLPKAGSTALWFRQPFHMAIMLGMLGGVFMVDMKAKKHGERKKKSSSSMAIPFDILFYTLGMIGLVFLGMEIYACTQPISKAAEKISYKQTGTFSYSASGTPILYDTGAASSGEPIFTRITCQLAAGFQYKLDIGGLEELQGVEHLDAIVEDDQTGWQRTIPLTADTSFDQPGFKSEASIDLCKIQKLVKSVEQETGIKTHNILKIVASVSVNGMIGGAAFTDTFHPELLFHFDTMRFYLDDGDRADLLQTITPGSFDNLKSIDNRFSFLGLKGTIRALRITAICGFLLSLVALLIVCFFWSRILRTDPERAIRLKYGSLLIDMKESGQGLESSALVIELASIDQLARLAERINCAIIHTISASGHIYLVKSEATLYRYTVPQSTIDNDAPDLTLNAESLEPSEEATSLENHS